MFIASLTELEGPGDALPGSFTYVGGIFDPEPSDLPPDVLTLAARRNEVPLVVTSLSTTYMHQESQLAAAIAALEGLRGVITVGSGLDHEQLPRGDDMVISRWIPHESLLPHADAVVTHAGHGTVMAALAAGVPLVCMPMGRDQHGNAEQVARLGAGVSVHANSDAKDLRAAIDRVLSQPSFRETARNLASSMSRLGGGERLAAEIESLACSNTTVTAPACSHRKGL